MASFTQLYTDAEIGEFSTLYDMGRIWETATDSERVLSARTVEAAWCGYPWIRSPFTDLTVRGQTAYLFARAARFVLENQGSQGVADGTIRDGLERFFAVGRALPMSFGTTTATATSSPTTGGGGGGSSGGGGGGGGDVDTDAIIAQAVAQSVAQSTQQRNAALAQVASARTAAIAAGVTSAVGQAETQTRSIVEDWAEVGNAALVPLAKRPGIALVSDSTLTDTAGKVGTTLYGGGTTAATALAYLNGANPASEITLEAADLTSHRAGFANFHHPEAFHEGGAIIPTEAVNNTGILGLFSYTADTPGQSRAGIDLWLTQGSALATNNNVPVHSITLRFTTADGTARAVTLGDSTSESVNIGGSVENYIRYRTAAGHDSAIAFEPNRSYAGITFTRSGETTAFNTHTGDQMLLLVDQHGLESYLSRPTSLINDLVARVEALEAAPSGGNGNGNGNGNGGTNGGGSTTPAVMRTWQTVMEWTGISQTTFTTGTYVVNTHFANQQALVDAFTNTDGEDIAWALVAQSFHGESPMFSRSFRPHSLESVGIFGSTYTVFCLSGNDAQIVAMLPNVEDQVATGITIMAGAVLVGSRNIAQIITTTNKLELWCLA